VAAALSRWRVRVARSLFQSEITMRLRTGILLSAALSLLLAASPAAAQSGYIIGTVTRQDTGAPLVNARVEARTVTNAVAARALSDGAGRFRLSGLNPGVYTVVVSVLGFDEARVGGVQVTSDAGANVTVTLAETIFVLDDVVISASRRQERALDAPAMSSVVNTREIQERPAVTPTDHVRNVPGIDIIQQGIQATNVVARGFNNIFSTTLHTLSDHRLASIPSLRVNLMHFIPANNEDIERIEVVLGPGAALYGPNTSSGVLHLMTRSPLDHQGSVVSLAGGNRSVFQGNFRTAQLVGENLGIKVSGQYLQGDEWPLDPASPYDAPVFSDEFFAGSTRDYRIQRYGGEARADWRLGPATTAVLSAGHTVAARGVELTGIGAGQTLDWSYSFVQARATRDRLFAQAYLNMSDAGDTYIIQNCPDIARITPDDPRCMRIVDNSRVLVSQLQHGLFLGGGRHNLTYGLDGIFTMPDTRGTIHGRNEGDDYIREAGAYLQAETSLTPRWDMVLAGRVDHHSRLENQAIFSPRAGLVFKPNQSHSLRATFNQAFSTPVSFNLFLDLDAGPAPGALGQILGYRVRAMGTEPQGFRFQRDDGSLYGMRSPFADADAIGHTRGTVLDIDPQTLWALGIVALQRLGRIDAATAEQLSDMTPLTGDIGINVLNLSTLTASRLESTTIPSVKRAQESRNTTFEVGYKGILGERILVSTGLWHEIRTNFTSPLTPFTPLLLLDSAGIYQVVRGAMEGSGSSAEEAHATASQLAAGLRGIPLGVIYSPDMEPADQAYILATYQNFGEVNLTGFDIGVTALLTDQLGLNLSASFVNRDHFVTGGYLVGLNAPSRKLSAALQYRNTALGFNGELRARHTAEFPVASAPYSATECIGAGQDVDLPGYTQPCVPASTLLDVNVGYQLPWRGASVQLSVTNLLDTENRSFAGVPHVGRFMLLRMRQEF
jgi:outer membrane receptor for ferrienterochelin and colicins